MPAGPKNEQSFFDLDDVIEAELLKARRLFFCKAFDDETARDVIRKLWYLDLVGPGKPITFFINSPGGSVDAGFAIWDQIKLIGSPITTVISGLAASMGSVLSLAESPGRRFATPRSRIMIHQPAIHGVVQGQVTDLEIQTKELLKTHLTLVELYMEATGKSRQEIEKALDRDTWMTAEEAKQFGLIDQVITSYEALKV